MQNRFFKPKITVELSADAQIDLDLGDLSAGQAGRQDFRGGVLRQRRGSVKAETVEVALSQSARSAGKSSASPRPRPMAATQLDGRRERPNLAPRPRRERMPSGRRCNRRKGPAKEPEEEEVPAKDLPLKRIVRPQGRTGDQARTVAADRRDAPAEDAKPEPKKPDEEAGGKPRRSPRSKTTTKDVFEK